MFEHFFRIFQQFFRTLKKFFSKDRWMFKRFVSNSRKIFPKYLNIFSLMFKQFRSNVLTIFLKYFNIFSVKFKQVFSNVLTVFLECSKKLYRMFFLWNARYVSKNKMYASILGRLQGKDSSLIRIHDGEKFNSF